MKNKHHSGYDLMWTKVIITIVMINFVTGNYNHGEIEPEVCMYLLIYNVDKNIYIFNWKKIAVYYKVSIVIIEKYFRLKNIYKEKKKNRWEQEYE